MLKKFVLPLFACILCMPASAQDESIILLIANVESMIVLDGIEKGQAQAGAAFRLTTTSGEHYLEARAMLNGASQTKGEVVQLEAGKQKIIKIEFVQLVNSVPNEALLVADINFNIPGLSEVLVWQADHKNEEYNYPAFYYAFEKGDEIVLDVMMSNQKGTNVINVSTYPNNVVRYTNNAFVSLQAQTIKVPERSIYRFSFATNHTFARNAFVKVRRKPASHETAAFNPNVSLQRILTPVPVAEPQSFFINGGRVAAAGGRSRVLLPVNLPENTVQWFYRFSAERSDADVKHVQSQFGLFGELTKLLFGLSKTGSSITDLAVESLVQPPGSDYCDIFFIEPKYIQPFSAMLDDQWQYLVEGSRTNFMAGNVKVSCCVTGNYYLGIRNPSSTWGINVSIEVVAITAKDAYVMEQN